MHFNFHAFILGAVQGLCEFLPVSSSGHLAILQNFFGFTDQNLVAFDLLLHCATVLVILIYFRSDIISILTEWFCGWVSREKFGGWYYGWAIILSVIITGIIGLPLRKTVDEISSSTLYVGCGLIFTALVMFYLAFIPIKRKSYSLLSIAVAVGIAQGFAVLPGVSRSGMTIAAGLIMGLRVVEAFKFSFMVSVPAVLGASLLEALKVFKSDEVIFLPDGYLWAVIFAFVLGFLALNIMRKLVVSGKWAYFGIYCFIVGAAAIYFSL